MEYMYESEQDEIESGRFMIIVNLFFLYVLLNQLDLVPKFW